jgi:hypothetical protein
MTKTTVESQYNEHFKHYEAFKQYGLIAKEHGMSAEFIEWMFRDLGISVIQIKTACNNALLEWDI